MVKHNVGKPTKRVENEDGWTWRTIKNFMKEAHKGDEIGFTFDKTHWVLRKGDFS